MPLIQPAKLSTPKRPVSSPEDDAGQRNKTIKPDDGSNGELLQIILSQNEEILASIDEIKKKFNDLEMKLSSRMDNIESVLQTQSSEISQLKNDIARKEIEREIVITGVPVIDSENTSKIFKQICTKLGYKDNYPYVSTERSTNKNTQRNTDERQTNDVTTTRPIFVEFATKRDKRSFLHRYFKVNKDLNQSCLGFQNTARIFVNDRLTKHDFQLKKEALKLKKDEKLFSVRTLGGRVYVKVTASSDEQLIDDNNALENIK
jgi:hypothetical protein